jgi:hypothetical protein
VVSGWRTMRAGYPAGACSSGPATYLV